MKQELDRCINRLETVSFRLRHHSPNGKKDDSFHYEADIIDVEVLPVLQQLGLEKGWGVQITRKDGTKFLASSGAGILSPVWVNSQRKYAVQWKKDLVKEGFKAKVVPVCFTRPVVVEVK